MSELLILRVRAAGRVLLDLARSDPLPAAGVLVALAVGAWYLLGAVRTGGGGAVELTEAGVGLLALLHLSRRDARFLTLAGHSPRRVFAAEYLILLLPVAGVLALGGEVRLVPAVLLAGLLLAMVPSGWFSLARARRAERRPVFRLAPLSAFEWVSGLRRSLLAFVVLYLVMIPASAFPAALVVLLLLATWTICGFYTEGEGWHLVQVFGLGPGAFLRAKIGRALGLWAISITPLAALFLARHTALWPVLVVALTGSAAVLVGSVAAKYAAYRQGRTWGAFGSLIPLVLTATLLVPPVAAYLLFRLWRMAERNLDPYLHAFD
jgi:hypothetical protein